MADSVAAPARGVIASAGGVPWYVWASIAGVTSAMVGVQWDISWHRSIGRDTFWTPAHLAIYLCGVIAGFSSAYLILATTLGKLADVRATSVKMWGFRGPLGAFITAWGGVAMLVSAPFDDWWHNAYGLDVKILSPPHMVLAAGIIAIQVGALMLVLGYMNRAEGEERGRLNWLFLYLGAMLLVVASILVMEHTGRVVQHRAEFYLTMAIAMPLPLVAVARASGHPWAATILTGISSLFTAALIWILPLFPAEPKLGPVFHPVTQFIPPEFPLLLIVPAVALDLLRRRTERWNAWLQAIAGGLVFLALFLAVQWPFANFLMSPAAANGFFGGIYLDYSQGPNSLEARGLFAPTEPAGQFFEALAWALAVAIGLTRLGLAAGNWMRTVRR